MKKNEDGNVNYEQFYFTEGVKLANMTYSDVKKGIKYLLTCFEMELKKGIIRDDTLEQLALAYTNAFHFGLSNIFFHIALNYVYKPTYLVHIAQNYILSGNAEQGSKILKSVLKDASVSNYTLKFAQNASDKLKTFSEEFYKSLTTEENFDKNMEEKIAIAREYMASAEFDKAIDIYKSLNACDNEQVRSELTLAYFFAGKYNKAEQILQKYGENTVRDLSNQLLISYEKRDKKGYDDTKNKLVNLNIEDDRERFNVGLSLAQTGESKLAVSFMEDYVSQGLDEIQVNFYYALACINAKLYDKAKEELLTLRDFDFFDRYMYDYFLKLCDEKRNEQVEYIFNLPVREFIKINGQIKKALELDGSKLEKFFNENFFLLLYLFKLQDIENINLLLYKLAPIDSAYASLLFNFLYVTDFIPYETKKNLILLRASVPKRKFKGITVNNPYIFNKNDEYSKLFEGNFDELGEQNKIINFASAKKQLENGQQITGEQISEERTFVARPQQIVESGVDKKSKCNLENCIGFTHDLDYFRIYLPNMEKLFKANPLLHDATLFALSYIVDNISVAGEYDVASVVQPLVKLLGGAEVDKFAISTYIAWKVLCNKRRSLNRIIKHFNLTPEKFYDFVKNFDLDLE